jgi:RHS repeat-associated protein
MDGSNNLQTRYLRGDGVDEIIARIESTGQPNPGAAWYLTDRLGSVRNLVDSTGAVQDTIVYDGFGNVTSESNGSFGDRWKWTGREWESNTGLQYNRARYYDPQTGRWTSQDPIGLAGADANFYRYATNNPLTESDPTGLVKFEFTTQPDYTPPIPVDEGAGKWKSVKLTRRLMVEARTLKRTLQGLILGGRYFKGLPMAATLLEWYLGNSGKTYRLTRKQMAAFLKVESNKKLFDDMAAAAAKFAVSLRSYNTICDFVSKKVADGDVTRDDDKNWFYAIGNYYAWGQFQAKVFPQKDPNKYHIALTCAFHLEKRYNWDVKTDKEVPLLFGLSITHKQVGLLHQLGWAKEFDIKGLYDSGVMRFVYTAKNGTVVRK